MQKENLETMVELLCEELQRTKWRVDYEKNRADKAEKELADLIKAREDNF